MLEGLLLCLELPLSVEGAQVLQTSADSTLLESSLRLPWRRDLASIQAAAVSPILGCVPGLWYAPEPRACRPTSEKGLSLEKD